MKRLLGLVLALVLMIEISPVLAQVEAGGICSSYTDFFAQWNVEVTSSTEGSLAVGSAVRVSDKANVVVASTYNALPSGRPIVSVYYLIGRYYSTTNLSSFTVTVTLYRDSAQVYQVSQVIPAATATGSNDYIYTLPDTIVSDRIRIEVVQPTDTPGVASGGFYFGVRRMCTPYSFPTPTFTPSPTYPAPTGSGPTRTPYPTITSTRTNTATFTKTPTRTKTPTPRPPTKTVVPTKTLAPSRTPLPSSTPGGATDTPDPTDTPIPTDTLIPTDTEVPSATPPLAESTLADYDYPSPVPPEADCIDPANPCRIFPEAQFPDWNIPSPTAVAALPTLTVIPSYTLNPVILGTGTPVEPVIIAEYATKIAGSLDLIATSQAGVIVDAQGTPVDAQNGIYQAGASIGSFWSIVRSVADADLGPVSNLLLFIVALIALNVVVRIILFAIPVIRKIIEFVQWLVGGLLKLFTGGILILCLLLISQPTQAQGTPTPPTVTPTLYPLQPSPTSKYQGLRPTPTLISLPPTTPLPIDSELFAEPLADWIVGGYNFLNRDEFPLMDIASFMIMAGVVVLLIVRLQKKLTQRSD